ncbi:hypothetical protein Cob_v004807 [Colletotrichum orbiculare MAFF 240422]|uniref:Uncharacterized protein n=1 Tax=Colletotrichum orbiculare (strain 104-T / ATCC 96160 / CBS 514.97 / LARS 414 / MAFF 240422) TaxID=1213857 RepID=N4UU13_COLOR|nr:hypothetical protein Cob_v004807 [Colletotrichum orbiculare MAFF 240422]
MLENAELLGEASARSQYGGMSTRELQLHTITLFEKIAQSQKTLERRIDAMEKLVAEHAASHTATTAASARFPRFQQLPPEIRHRIWALTLPTRALRLPPRKPQQAAAMTASSSSSSSSSSGLGPPTATAAVCREARAVATQHAGNVVLAGARRWFDRRRDVLVLERWVDVEADAPRGIRDVVRAARHLLLPRAGAEWYLRVFRHAESVRRVSVTFDTCLASRCAWDGAVVERFFDGDAVELLDLEDAGEIARARGVLGHYWRCPFFCDFDLEAWAAQRVKCDRTGEGWMKKLDGMWMSEVARAWVAARVDGCKVAMAMDVDDGDTRAALEGMPEVRLVRAYLLDDFHGTN